MTAAEKGPLTHQATAPRAGAVAGILFAVLFGVSIALIRLAVPANLADLSAWTEAAQARVALALRLMPFAGIFFLWFVGVIRDHLGESEDRFFATVTLGSALAFLALTFAASGIAGGLLDSYRIAGSQVIPLGVYLFARSAMSEVFNTYAVKMASVFMFSLSTLWLRTRTMPRLLSFVTYALALALLIIFTRSLWVLVVFPAWMLVVSIYILISGFRHPS
jgi:hypothetical protein